MANEEHLGSLAEAVLEAVRENAEVGGKVDEVRSATRNQILNNSEWLPLKLYEARWRTKRRDSSISIIEEDPY